MKIDCCCCWCWYFVLVRNAPTALFLTTVKGFVQTSFMGEWGRNHWQKEARGQAGRCKKKQEPSISVSPFCKRSLKQNTCPKFNSMQLLAASSRAPCMLQTIRKLLATRHGVSFLTVDMPSNALPVYHMMLYRTWIRPCSCITCACQRPFSLHCSVSHTYTVLYAFFSVVLPIQR